MRASIAIFLGILATWRAVIDWRATIGEGYAYRFGKLGDLVGGWWPDGAGGTLAAVVLAVPVAPALAAAALAVWIGRTRAARSRTRW